jgi:hypothetical protein
MGIHALYRGYRREWTFCACGAQNAFVTSKAFGIPQAPLPLAAILNSPHRHVERACSTSRIQRNLSVIFICRQVSEYRIYLTDEMNIANLTYF